VLNVTDQLDVSAALTPPPGKPVVSNSLEKRKKFASADNLPQVLQASWSNSWCGCVWHCCVRSLIRFHDIRICPCNVSVDWIFKRIQRTTFSSVSNHGSDSYKKHNTVNMGALALLTDVSNFYYYD